MAISVSASDASHRRSSPGSRTGPSGTAPTCGRSRPRSSDYLIGLYQRACAFADETITSLDLDTPGSVAHWPEDRRATTLGVLLIRMVDETAHHAGHADIVRELIDGTGGSDSDVLDEAGWTKYRQTIQQAAETFK